MKTFESGLYSVYKFFNPWWDRFPGPLVRRVFPRRLRASVQGDSLRANRINQILNTLSSPTDYLEVGLDRGLTFEQVACATKWGVDPKIGFRKSFLPSNVLIFEKTSDDFFSSLESEVTFDVVYLDGLHTWQQTYRDLLNALNHLNAGGVVLVDDVFPSTEHSALPDESQARKALRKSGLKAASWFGDVFKTILIVAEHHPELDFVTFFSGGHGQTAIWRNRPQQGRYDPEFGEDVFATADHNSYSEVFATGNAEKTLCCQADEPAIQRVTSATRM